MERSAGIKPASSVWKTEAQSLRQPRIVKDLATVAGVEPASSVLETNSAPLLTAVGVSDRSRTG